MYVNVYYGVERFPPSVWKPIELYKPPRSTELDRRARAFYVFEQEHYSPRKPWLKWDNLSQKERDYWRACVVRGTTAKKRVV